MASGRPVFLWALGLAGAWGLSLAAPAAQNSPEPSLDEQFQARIKPLLSSYCYKCHGPQLKPKADLNLTKYQTERSVRENRKLMKEVLVKIHTLEMPPEGSPQPKPEERKLITDWFEAALNRVDPNAPRTAGRVVCRRLNREEYRRTIRDLLGVEFDPTKDFPADDLGYGFDTVGDVLSLPPLLMEKYLAAARWIADRAVQGPERDRLVFVSRPGGAKKPRDAAREVLTRLATRAFRRPAAADEVERLVKLFDVGEKHEPDFERAMALPLRALLVSPHFLLRAEGTAGEGVQPLTDWELATRLSYFLWSSMPDDELFELARRGVLKDPAVLEAQALRLLKDSRASALAENFAPQWLQVRRLEEIHFDPKLFPAFDPRLRADMIREVVLFFEAVLREDRSVLDLLDADFTFVNDRLARHYGLAAPAGGGFERVKLPDGRRGGVVTMAAVLAATSDPDRTSPVKRGKWVLEAILGTPPPPPVPDAANLKPEPDDARLTLRQRMERHRRDPNCASCHSRMDPIGFGLENFDALGVWRERDGGLPLDVSAALPDGRAFKGPIELKNLLKERKDDFAACLVEKLMTYGLGRGVEHFDQPVIDEIVRAAAPGGYRFSTLIAGIVKSYPFLNRQKERGKR